MGIFVRCLCLNVTVHLASKPTVVQDVSSLPIAKTTIKSIGETELGVGGVAKEFEQLTSSRSVDGPWRCLACVNCRSDIFLQNDANKSHIYVSMTLRLLQDGDDVSQVSAPQNFHFSPTFRIFLENNDEVANSLLEAPDVYDTTSVELLQSIQKRIESTVAGEAQQMQERIRAFEHQQQEAFREFQVVAYRDRKILWHNICSQRRQQAPSRQQPPTTPASPASVVTVPVVAEAVPTAAPAATTPPKAPAAAPGSGASAAPTSPAPPPGTWVPALSSRVKTELDQQQQQAQPQPGPIATRTSFIVQSPRPVSPRPAGSGGTEAGVFRLEEEAADEPPPTSSAGAEGGSADIVAAVPVAAPVLLRPAGASQAITMPGQPPVATAASMFGTSVPINIPVRSAVTSFEADETGGDLVDVPLSSTQRIKGYL